MPPDMYSGVQPAASRQEGAKRGRSAASTEEASRYTAMAAGIELAAPVSHGGPARPPIEAGEDAAELPAEPRWSELFALTAASS